ncbi:MAG: hypothetical protein M1820_006130 [Bogoriella megaspora]|nr:MAG: hypothetical protein M1820_006130 [Bogoriella megaspora]
MARASLALRELDTPLPPRRLHYDFSSNNVAILLSDILDEITSRRRLHDWDKDLQADSLKGLTSLARSFLRENYDGASNLLLKQGGVEEVLTRYGVNHKQPVDPDTSDVSSFLFFSKFGKNNASRDSARAFSIHISIAKSNSYLNEQMNVSQQSAIILLQTSCLRLQQESFAFIEKFIDSHFSNRASFRDPDQMQPAPGLSVYSSEQKCYRRVTLSCHFPYFELDPINIDVAASGLELGAYDRVKSSLTVSEAELRSKSSSVLLTLVSPTESATFEEEVRLLSNPEALWSVVIINSPISFSRHADLAENLTPIAQYLRGIAACLQVQHYHAQHMFQDLFMRPNARSDDYIDDLLDDEAFTKSRLFHRVVKSSHALHDRISTLLRFVQRLKSQHLEPLTSRAHSYEAVGIAHWQRHLASEIVALEELAQSTTSLRTIAQEDRTALHGVTAVLEARLALQQGDRMKTFTYLATAYLPLATVASIYSMSVLPSAASFASFFVVFAVFMVVTILSGISMSRAKSKFNHGYSKAPTADELTKILRHLWSHVEEYARQYLILLTPPDSFAQDEDGPQMIFAGGIGVLANLWNGWADIAIIRYVSAPGFAFYFMFIDATLLVATVESSTQPGRYKVSMESLLIFISYGTSRDDTSMDHNGWDCVRALDV